MDATIMHALRTERTIDITTVGRRTGKPSRVEMWFHNIDDGIFITGTPGSRDWYANMLHNPRFIFHLKRSVHIDLPAIARPIMEGPQRYEVLSQITKRVGAANNLEGWVDGAPLVEVRLDATWLPFPDESKITSSNDGA